MKILNRDEMCGCSCDCKNHCSCACNCYSEFIELTGLCCQLTSENKHSIDIIGKLILKEIKRLQELFEGRKND